MAQADDSAIRGAFFGLLVLFGIFVLAGWLFDHLTHRNASAEESVLSIAVYAPAVPESQWGNASNGLRSKLSFNRIDPSQFTDIAINIQYKNITDDVISFLFDPNDTLKAVSAVNKDKWKLKLVPIPKVFMSGEQYEELYKSSIEKINPGEIFEREIKCQIENVVKDTGFISGYFDVVCNIEIDENKISQIQATSDQALWTGKIKSGECEIFLTMPHDGGCNDCHGDADYHHGLDHDCRFCHAEGTDVLNETCIRCHKRHEQKEYGRRRVLGPDGDFDNSSRHISGLIKDSDCLVCHDMEKHGYGVVILADPNSPDKGTWTDHYTEFCLSCHNSNPPEKVKFPEKSANTGTEDYSMFLETYDYSEYDSDYSDYDSPAEDDSGYPEVTFSPEESSGYQGVDSMLTDSTSDSKGKFHSDSGVFIYDKSDFINSDLYKKNVECTDCHRSHGSRRPTLLKNVHGPDDKIRI
jgi:hypothetical protein